MTDRQHPAAHADDAPWPGHALPCPECGTSVEASRATPVGDHEIEALHRCPVCKFEGSSTWEARRG